jgi:hypothetical protein
MLDFLVGNEAVSEQPRACVLAAGHRSGSARNEVSVAAEDVAGRKTLAPAFCAP